MEFIRMYFLFIPIIFGAITLTGWINDHLFDGNLGFFGKAAIWVVMVPVTVILSGVIKGIYGTR